MLNKVVLAGKFTGDCIQVNIADKKVWAIKIFLEATDDMENISCIDVIVSDNMIDTVKLQPSNSIIGIKGIIADVDNEKDDINRRAVVRVIAKSITFLGE